MYQTTKPIVTLAGNGARIRAYSNVTEAMFPPDQWAALLAEGAVVELTQPDPEPQPATKTTKRSKS
jgi:hypothetical protein